MPGLAHLMEHCMFEAAQKVTLASGSASRDTQSFADVSRSAT